MDLSAAGLREQPFPTDGVPLSLVSYRSQRDALAMLRETCDTPHGLAVLQGPSLSGKSTLLKRFVGSLDRDMAVAFVDGAGLNTRELLENTLRQFGYELDCDSNNELFAMIRVFAMQQTARHEPPLLIIENAHGLMPGALHTLCELAELKVRNVSALHIVLVSDRSLARILELPLMEAVAKRVSADFHLHPMTREESRQYLYVKLRAAGAASPKQIFPDAICDALWEASAGWPGILDRLALLAIAKTEALPVPEDVVERPILPNGTWDDAHLEQIDEAIAPILANPKLFVTHEGETVMELPLDRARVLIGRADHNDISIQSRFVSRHHAMIARHGNTTFLMDLNSTNGTFVTSRRISNQVLRDNDIITVGNHRIKFSDPFASSRGTLEGIEFTDTVIMKSIDDMRQLLAEENTAMLPAASDDILR